MTARPRRVRPRSPRLWARTPLWARLLVCTLALAAIGLGVTGVVGVNLFRSYLLDQSGQQLTTIARTIATADWNRPIDRPLSCGSLPSDNAVELISAAGADTVASSCGATVDRLAVRPDLPSAVALAEAAAAGVPITETGTAGTAKFEWQVVVTHARFRNAQAEASTGPRAVGAEAAAASTAPPAPAGSIDGYVVVATPLSTVDETVGHLADLDYAVDAAVGLALFALGYVLVRRTLRPLRRIESAAAAISAGDLTGRVPLGHPNTEIGQLSRSLNGMLGQIESAFGAKALSEAEALRSEAQMRQFAADAGHELRTPVASIRGMTELYRQGAVDSRGMPDLMRRIEDEATRMGLLIEDLLLLARLDQRRPLARDRVHLVALAADSIVAARARESDVRIELQVERPAVAAGENSRVREPVVIGDEDQLRQALDNLLTNAVRHTPHGTPITVRVRSADRSGRCLLEVADEGPGLSAADAERVFERFYRADPSRTRTSAQQGSGLGLSIVAAIAEAHGGCAEVRSAPGRGSCFSLSLPASAGQEVKAEPETPV